MNRRSLMLITFLLLCCGYFEQSPAFAENVFRVGVIAPLSGPLAEYGLASQNGIELARAQHPELFTSIEFVYEDSQWDAKAAISAFNSLRSQKQVSLVYNWGNPTTEAIAPLAERYHLPLIGLSLDPAVALKRQYVIRAINSAADFASAAAAYVRQKQFKNVGVVIADNTYVQGLFNGLQKSLPQNVKIEIVDRYNIQDQDFRSSISKIRTKQYDCLGVFLISGQVSNFYKQLSDQAISVPTIGTDFFESTTEIRLARGGMNGAVYPHLGITPKFRADYVSRFKNDYQIAYAGNAYDLAIAWGTLFNKLSSPIGPEEIMAKLRSVKDSSGIGGRFSFAHSPDDGPHYHFPVQLKRIVGETIETVLMEDKAAEGGSTLGHVASKP